MDLFTDVIPIEKPIRESRNKKYDSLQIGDNESKGLKIDKSGIWLGGKRFIDASFSVDMEGNGKFKGTLLAGSLIIDPTFSYTGGSSMVDTGSGGTVLVGGVTFNTRNVKVGANTYKFLIQ